MSTEKLPKGAEALLIAINTPNIRGTIGIPVLIWGRPGEGKSSFLEGMSKAEFPVLTLIASIHDPTDFSGLPIMHEGKVRYAIPEWVEKFGEKGEGILFLDELTTAPPSVQAALLRVVLERKVGFHDLPEGVRIVSAANPPDLMTGGWELSPPLRNRFVHLNWELPASVYKNALLNGYEKASMPEIPVAEHKLATQKYKNLINAFLNVNPNLLTCSPDSDRYGFASPRTWDYAALLMASCSILKLSPLEKNASSTVFLELLSGCLGDGIASNFISFLRNINVPNPLKVLEGEITVDLTKLNESELFVLFTGFRHHLKRSEEDDVILRRSKVLMDLVDDVVELKKKDIIFPTMRYLAKEEHLMARMIKGTHNVDEVLNKKVMDFLDRFFSEDGFDEYVNILG